VELLYFTLGARFSAVALFSLNIPTRFSFGRDSPLVRERFLFFLFLSFRELADIADLSTRGSTDAYCKLLKYRHGIA